MKTSFKRQRGLTFISLIFVLGIVGFFVLLILKVGPIYLDHSKVLSALAAVEEAPDAAMLSEHDIREMLRKRFDLNYVSDVEASDIKIYKSGYYLKVEIEYEVVKKIMGNLSVLVEFDDVIEVGSE